jgi:para-aminobenzoate synthetase component 1
MTSDGLPSGKRRFVSFPITDFQKTKRQMLTWAASHDTDAGAGIFCFLDNHGYPAAINPGFECLLAAGVHDSLEAQAGQAFSQLKEWTLDRGEWLFGHFAYDLAT